MLVLVTGLGRGRGGVSTGVGMVLGLGLGLCMAAGLKGMPGANVGSLVTGSTDGLGATGVGAGGGIASAAELGDGDRVTRGMGSGEGTAMKRGPE